MYKGCFVSLLHGKPIEIGNTAPRVSQMITEQQGSRSAVLSVSIGSPWHPLYFKMELKRLVRGSKSERSDNWTTLKVNVLRTCIQHIHPNRRDYLATFYFQFCNLDVVDVSDEDVSSTVPAVYLLFVLSKVTIMDRQQSNRNLHLTRFSNHIRVTRKFE